MNSLYTLALRQSTSLNSDLDSYSSLPPTSTQLSALSGQLTAGIAAFSRTLDDYDSFARREIVDVKKEKALQRVARFREEERAHRDRWDRCRKDMQQKQLASSRSELLPPSASSSASTHNYSASLNSRTGYRPTSSSTSSGAYNPQPPADVSIPMGGGGTNDYHSSVHNNSRTNHALREHDFLGSTSASLDAYLAQGQAVLGNLAGQREVMKGTQRRLLSAANTLGLSRSTISFIERRTKADHWILLGGGAGTLVCFWLILKYFG